MKNFIIKQPRFSFRLSVLERFGKPMGNLIQSQSFYWTPKRKLYHALFAEISLSTRVLAKMCCRINKALFCIPLTGFGLFIGWLHLISFVIAAAALIALGFISLTSGRSKFSVWLNLKCLRYFLRWHQCFCFDFVGIARHMHLLH